MRKLLTDGQEETSDADPPQYGGTFLRTTRFQGLTRLLVASILLAGISAGAWGQTFDELLGNYRQRRSPVCVIYAHVLAVAEADPAGLATLIRAGRDVWSVRLAGNRWAYVTRADVEKSIANGFSTGEPDNLLTIYSIALSKRSEGYNAATGMLDYGRVDFGQFVGTGRWTLYDDKQGKGRSLSEGLDRLVREALPDGRPRNPSTVGFGFLDKKSIPDLVGAVQKSKLIGIHDFSVSRYDAAKKTVDLRNPHNPKEILEVPIELLRRIPAGIDFMEPKAE
jgi:hypothetical protein